MSEHVLAPEPGKQDVYKPGQLLKLDGNNQVGCLLGRLHYLC